MSPALDFMGGCGIIAGMSENPKVPQRTILRARGFAGAALHCGRKVRVRLLPAGENAGVVFRRTDLGGAEVRAAPECVSETNLATGFKNGRAEVCTVEHLLSALAATGIDNIVAELDGPEIPIADGSANPWLLLLRHCRLQKQQAPKRLVRVLRPVEVADGKRRARFSPLDLGGGLTYSARIDYPHRVVSRTARDFSYDLNPQTYAREISRARTFAYIRDVEAMRRAKRALGGSLDCAVVYDDHRALNEEGLRYADEFIRHKVLDAIGDCYAGGVLIAGKWRGELPGHDLNNKLVRKLMATADAWEWAEAEDNTTGAEKEEGRFSLSPFPVLRPLAA